MQKTLIHSCCGPCSVSCFEVLKDQGFDFASYFYNPNIHPWKEYEARFDSWHKLCDAVKVEAIGKPDYPLEKWLSAVGGKPEDRCLFCYESRLRQTAIKAKELGFSAFTTTLLISPYQNHELICQIALKAAESFGLNFLYFDFRPFFRQGQNKAKELGLYRQKYCGCIYSEKERYLKND